VSLRARLGLVAAAAVAAAVLLASVVVYFIVQNELRGQVDRNLRDQVEQVTRVIGFQFFSTAFAPNQYLLQVPTQPFASPFQLVDRDGGLYRLPRSFGKPQPALPGFDKALEVATGQRGDFYFEDHFNGQHVRLLAAALPGAGGYAIVVATPLTNVDHELSKIRLWLLLVALGGIGIASVLGFLVARAALKPVRDLSDTAEHVRATRDLSQRIEVSGNDELSRLATTFNAMLQSLDEAQQRQRQLVQDASHELRTPLTSLRTNIEVLAMQGGGLPQEEREQLLEDVVAQLREMTDLITELTELARGEEQQTALEEVRLDMLTEYAIRRAARNHPDVPIEADLAPTMIVGMPASLERAIANLLDNAAKWSPRGEPVEVKLDGGELTVRDHGPGISEADRPHVFERFYRATSARSMPGSGLGLAIVLQVAEMHGGTIVAEEAPGGGTLMRLRLDARVVAEPAAASNPVEA
jgi:two-component system sensor histidine kinase MprB